MLGGLLAGVTVSGVLMAIFQSNAGGAWDNAKKMIEENPNIDGENNGKGSEAHKAAVVGDTVGDPFKDTSGPSLNILLKLMSVVALVIAPSIALEVDNTTNDTNLTQHEIILNENANETNAAEYVKELKETGITTNDQTADQRVDDTHAAKTNNKIHPKGYKSNI